MLGPLPPYGLRPERPIARLQCLAQYFQTLPFSRSRANPPKDSFPVVDDSPGTPGFTSHNPV
jgi:hypothetical protein